MLVELHGLKSQDGSVSPCTEERARWCSLCMLVVWNGYSNVDVTFLDRTICFYYCYITSSAFESFSLPEAQEEVCHIGVICDHCLCPLRTEKPPFLNQCHCNAISQTWMVKWNTALLNHRIELLSFIEEGHLFKIWIPVLCTYSCAQWDDINFF